MDIPGPLVFVFWAAIVTFAVFTIVVMWTVFQAALDIREYLANERSKESARIREKYR